MRRFLSRLLQRLRLEPREPPYLPDLSDAAFLARLSVREPAFARAQALLASGDGAAARAAVVGHFLRRPDPAYFIRPVEAGALAARLRQERPAAVQALKSRVHADRSEGLQVVSRRDAPLDAGLSWCNIPPGPGADDLFAAQPHRFGFVPRLAIAALHGDDTLPVLGQVLEGWVGAVAAGEPECYHSPLAVLYRVLACSWAWVLVGGSDASNPLRNDVVFTLLKILAADRDYLLPTIGTSYPNNHLLADGFAAWFLGLLYPEFGDADALRLRGDELFVRELLRQFLADGGNFEHSTHYHELGCEMAAAYVLLSQRNGLTPAQAVVSRLQAMLTFQAALGGPEAQALPLGDSTEDPLFPLDANHGWANGGLRELLRAIFVPELAAAPADDATVERAFWLLGGGLVPEPAVAARETSAHFDDAGVHVLTDAASSARLVFRAGPMEGRALSAGHAHSDLLSVHLSVAGRPLIVNSGTGTYRAAGPRWPAGVPDWRAYFAGPRSHNAVFVGADPFGPMTGDFRNRDVPCRVRETARGSAPGVSWLEFQVVSAHPGVRLRRCVVHVDGFGWLVVDEWPDGPDCSASFGLQFAAGTEVGLVGGTRAVAVLGRVACTLDLEPAWVAMSVLCGSERPLGGWVSPRYGVLEAAPQLRANGRPDRCRAAALIRSVRAGADDAVQWLRNAEGVAVRVRDGSDTWVVAWRGVGAASGFEPWGLVCDTSAAFRREPGGKPQAASPA